MVGLFIRIISLNRRNIAIASSIFLGGVVGGYFFVDKENEFVLKLLEQIAEIVTRIESNDSVIYTIFTIFLNNLKISILMIVIGALFLGIFPIISLIVNGLVIGFVLRMIAISSENPLDFFLFGLLPHGIIEIPAIIIAAALGMHLGFSLISRIGKYNKEFFLGLLRQTLVTVLGVTLLLLLAAILESTLTSYLLEKFANI